MIRVFLADSHTVFRQALIRLLSDETDIRVVGEAGDGTGTLDGVRHAPCDVCLLEFAMPGRSGIELLRLLHQDQPDLAILVLSAQSEQTHAVRCIRAGAQGYLCKTSSAAMVLDGIRRLAAGQMVLNPALTQELALTMLTENNDEPHRRLSDREYQVFGRLVAGFPVSRIARDLQVSVKTVSTHKTRIQHKLQCNGIADMVRYAQQHDLLEQMNKG